MRLFAPILAFVDLETTGTAPPCDAITEIGIVRLSAEIQRIEFEETAGEIGALLRESVLVKAMLPAHNRALRRKAESGVLDLPETPGPPTYVRTAAVEPSE